MSLIDSMKSCFGTEELPTEPIFRAVLFGDTAGYFENVKSIVHYSPEEICLCLKKGVLKIQGAGLYIKKYCSGDIVVCGKIKALIRD